jgi:mono/diheme cytochrome c family protein
MKTPCCVLGLLLVIAVFPEARAGETKLVQDQVKMGAVDYKDFCAACHGVDARGNGPVAKELKTAPPSLRNLVARWNGVFDVDEVVQIIDGRDMPRAHGTPEMPVWGSLFRLVAELSGILEPDTKDTEKDAQKRMLAIAKYLETIQGK